MPTADPARCPSCGTERPANAPGGLCPRCVLRHAMESDSSADDTPAPGSSRLGPVLETMTLTTGSVPRIRLFERRCDGGGDGEPDPAVRTGSSEMPRSHGDAEHLELLGEIARGGMGAVLKGRDADLGRDLAVKVLLEAHRDKPELVRRFVEEAQIGGQLQHPGIVPVYELGTFADRRPYLHHEAGQGPHPGRAAATTGTTPRDDLPRFLAIFEQVCQTMAYAHARGVIHRDLKPSNVMVGSLRRGAGDGLGPGQGPARRAASPTRPQAGRRTDDGERHPHGAERLGRATRSQAGSVLGTPAYMAPEQARGEVERVDERADVFGLGSILCEILTGAAGLHAAGSAARSSARRRGATWPTPSPGWTPAGPTPS